MAARAALLIATLAAQAACAPRGPKALTPQQLESLASRTVEAPFDEAYDAAWLVLEGAGWTITASDRRAGTLETNAVVLPPGVGRAWSVAVSQDGASPRVTLLPRVFRGEAEVTGEMHWTLDGPSGEQAKWDDLFARMAVLFEAWRTHPELKLERARAELDAAGLRMLVPGWKHYDFAVDRRSLAVQGDGSVPVPTFFVRLERRAPQPDPEAMPRAALEKATKGRLVVPDQTWAEAPPWMEGEVRVGKDLAPAAVRWRRWDALSPAWAVRVVAVCPDGAEGCEAEVARALESAVNTDAAVPGFKVR